MDVQPLEGVENQSSRWIPVNKRKPRDANRKMSNADGGKPGPAAVKKSAPLVVGSKDKVDLIKRKVPKGSVVAITGRNEDFSYAETLKNAREKISLIELGIDHSHIRKAANGGVLIEIPGNDSAAKADLLANKLNNLGMDANIARPMAKGEIKLYNMDGSISAQEVCFMLADIGECPENLIKVSKIRQQRNGLNFVVVSCPLQLAIKVAKMGKLQIGWSIAGIELLKKRLPKCFKCWHFGHYKNTCNSVADRQGCCFKCGGIGHNLNECKNTFKCWACIDIGLDGNHMSGSNQCSSYNKIIQARRALETTYVPND